MKPYLQDPDLTLYQGDAFEVLRTLPGESVHMCVTSPPFYGLRDYGVEGQIGLEPTPEEWCAKLVEVFREVRRVLRSDGTCWVEVGDSYNSGTGAKRQASDVDHGAWQLGSSAGHERMNVPGVKVKDLIGAPWMLAFALRADGWYLRSDIVWSRPNPMPESVTDRPTKSHSYVFLLSKSARYFFDQEAVREAATNGERFHGGYDKPGILKVTAARNGREDAENQIAGRNVRSVWEIATEPYPEAHFATYPQELVRRCILAGSSERGCCPECGAPWMREVEQAEPPENYTPGHTPAFKTRRFASATGGYTRPTLTTGWHPSCGCSWSSGHTPDLRRPTPIPCTVLDPFAGSGTTALVARKHGRRSILIELSETYCGLAARRLSQLSLLAEAQ